MLRRVRQIADLDEISNVEIYIKAVDGLLFLLRLSKKMESLTFPEKYFRAGSPSWKPQKRKRSRGFQIQYVVMQNCHRFWTWELTMRMRTHSRFRSHHWEQSWELKNKELSHFLGPRNRSFSIPDNDSPLSSWIKIDVGIRRMYGEELRSRPISTVIRSTVDL